ncbi:MAG: glycosyltransferase family 4 protein [Spirochaetota bacterium]|nr:glycosyltransferase family 4 protein [Spirochaetota bacterium]
MRICLLCYRGNPYSGGQGIYLKYIADELLRQGHDVHAIIGPPYPTMSKGVTVHYIYNNEYFIKKGIHVINNEFPFNVLSPINFYEYFSTRFGIFSEIMAFSIRAYLKLKELSRQIKFDIIHDNQCLGYGLLLMKSLGIPIIATVHHPLHIDLEKTVERAPNFRVKMGPVLFYPVLMQRLVTPRLDHVIVVSEDSKKKTNRYLKVPMQKQTVVYNGLDRSIFRPIKGIKKKRGKLIFVGNVEDRKKGFVYLLKAMKQVNKKAFLTVVDGGSPHRKSTLRLMKMLGVGDNIEFTGKVTIEELVKHYCESEIAIVPSVYEGFGFPAAEAMSCGIPVVSSDGGALPEVVGDAGIVVPAKDDVALAGAINDLLKDGERLKLMAQNGIKRVEECFNWEIAVNQMIGVYSKFV